MKPSQRFLLAIRVVSNGTAHLILSIAIQLVSVSKMMLILENPFLVGVMAYFAINEAITIHEVVVFCMTVIGIIVMQKDRSPNADAEYETLGIALTILAGMLLNAG